MKELGKWQIVSFISRMMAMALGIIQSFVIIRILTVSEWGLVQLAASIGGALGIYQHLGLSSASTREIASAKDDTQVFKIFLTSVFIRYCVTFPIALALIIFADKLALQVYKNEALILPLRIYGITIMFQGAQGLLNSVISGTKRFRQLFILQVCLAVMSVIIYLPLVFFFRVNGYFYALFSFNLLNTLILIYLGLRPLKGKLQLPGLREFKILFRDIVSISLAIYAVAIIDTNWEKFGPNVLGLSNSPEVIATFAFAMLYARKILSISDSVTDVNLPVLSEKFVTDFEDFKVVFTKNFNKVFGFIILCATVALFWAPQIITFVVGSNKYSGAYPLILPILLAFVVYSMIDIAKSSVFIPAKLTKSMLLSFVILLSGTAVFYFMFNTHINDLKLMAWAMAFGSASAFLYTIFVVIRKLKFRFFNYKHAFIMFQGFLIGYGGLNYGLFAKSLAFIPLMLLLVWGLHVADLIKNAEFVSLFKTGMKFNPLKKVKK